MDESKVAAEHRCLRSVLAAMLIVDDHVDPDEVEAACRVYADQTGLTLDPQVLRTAAEELRTGSTQVEETLGGLAAPLDLEAKERILEAALHVASADGFVVEEEETLLATIAAALSLTEGQYRRTMERLLGRD